MNARGVAVAAARFWGAISLLSGVAYLAGAAVLFLMAMWPLRTLKELLSGIIGGLLVYGLMSVVAGVILIAAARWIANFAVRGISPSDDAGVFS